MKDIERILTLIAQNAINKYMALDCKYVKKDLGFTKQKAIIGDIVMIKNRRIDYAKNTQDIIFGIIEYVSDNKKDVQIKEIGGERKTICDINDLCFIDIDENICCLYTGKRYDIYKKIMKAINNVIPLVNSFEIITVTIDKDATDAFLYLFFNKSKRAYTMNIGCYENIKISDIEKEILNEVKSEILK